MAGCLCNSSLLSRVENSHRLVLNHSTEHLAIGAPANGGGVIGHVSESNHWVVTSILIDIPNLHRLVDRVRSEQILGSLVPLDTDTFACVRLELEIALGSVTLTSETFVIFIESPELGLTVLGTGSEKTVLEGRPLAVEDISNVALKQGDVSVESLRLVGIEDSDSRCLAPVHGDHLAV